MEKTGGLEFNRCRKETSNMNSLYDLFFNTLLKADLQSSEGIITV